MSDQAQLLVDCRHEEVEGLSSTALIPLGDVPGFAASARHLLLRPDPRPQSPADPALLALYEAVGKYVRSRRAAGERPEQVLSSLKATVRAIPRAELPSSDASLVCEVIVPLAIEEYYW